MYDEYLDFAKQLAHEAGEIMRKYFLVTDKEWKSDNTPLTQADTEINDLVIERINAKYPYHSILGEEKSDIKDSDFTWVCDPVDGTMPYANGLPISTFSLALCNNGNPVVGVVYDPFTDRLFYGSSSEGAFCNDERILVNAKGLKGALLDLEGVGNGESGVADCDGLVSLLIDNEAQMVSLWSTILPACLVAAGQFSAVVFNICKPEDGAAIKVIVEEAGGRVTDMFGNEQRYDGATKGFIASNGIIHDQLISSIKEFNTDEV